MNKRTAATIQVAGLTVDAEQYPVGVGNPKPFLGWKLTSAIRGQRQTAYRVLVDSDPAKLEMDLGSAWDSGVVSSCASNQIAYEGIPLPSDTKVYWKVMVWDRSGKPSPWSAVNSWSTGLLEKHDWKASWITKPELHLTERMDLTGESWIVHEETWRKPKTIDVYSGDKAAFRLAFDLPEELHVRAAHWMGTGDCRAYVYLNGELIVCGYHFQYLHWVDVTDLVQPGRNVLGASVSIGASYGVGLDCAAFVGKLRVQLSDGREILVATDENWKRAPSPESGWLEQDFDDTHWPAAVRAAAFGQVPWLGPFHVPPRPTHLNRNHNFYARKTFLISGTIKRATVYASALGVYELTLNGGKVGEDLLTPGWTDYRKRVIAQAYDVTSLLEPGANAVGLAVGPGWYAGSVGMFGPYQYGERPYALLQLHVEYADGRVEVIATDDTWTTSSGPIQYSDLLMGEIYDATQEIAGWDEAGFDDSGWQPVERLALGQSHPEIGFHPGPMVRAVEQLPPFSVKRLDPDRYIVDFGRNISGWVKIRAIGPRGTRIRMRFAEMLLADGSLYTTNLRSARQTDVYVMRGDGEEEVYEPRFTFHGFRYAEVSGYPGELKPEDVMAIMVYSDLPLGGDLTTSDPLLNQLQANIVLGQTGNFLSVPTDCPQRDERLGWTGDAQIFVRTASYNRNTLNFFRKWLLDVRDAQHESGAVTNVAPTLGWLWAGVAAWGDAITIVPWTLYRMYGDRSLLEENYEAMVRHVHYMKKHSVYWVRPAEGFGDWLSIEADTPKDLLGTAYFAYSTHILAEVARVLGYEAESEQYRGWFREIREAFQVAFVESDGTVEGGTQTGYLLALHMQLLPEELREKAIRHLVDDIQAKGEHLSTGFIGVSYLLPVLTEAGHLELAYRLLQQETFPSWLYSVLQGATTIWERWNGWTHDSGFYSPVMNSFNHYSLGSVGEWMYRYMAGIELDPEVPGFRRILLKPRPGGKLSRVQAVYESPYGEIVSDWAIEGKRFVYKISVPVNSTALVSIPSKAAVWADLGMTVPLSTLDDVEHIRQEQDRCEFEVGSGQYVFVSVWS
ncbi:family 78 glycoside hydrolase catalytic domain [Paenibacillus koleovorans]|uniref:family 78 glycoside hydrolase catalytic domain n=1 Tax=Paenibacillus koleovorans TaxID=121608 RepID=UPI000FD8A3A9|nr:family 78 glycoside hydrolase catalytic domain [Paenibacillus koleovorans]